MPLRPIDAVFIHPERRCYVIYHGGELWQLTRMKLDDASWWRRQPYRGDVSALYLSQRQYIDDFDLSTKLRTLDLPKNLHGISFPKFEDWWLTHGFDWLKDIIIKGDSPLAAHSVEAKEKVSSASVNQALSSTASSANNANSKPADTQVSPSKPARPSSGNIFDDMLAELVDEVLNTH